MLIEDFRHPQPVTKRFAKRIGPVIEIAGNDQRRFCRCCGHHRLDQRLGLPQTTAGKQPQMNDIAMHGRVSRLQHAMQNAARFERMVGDIMIEGRGNRKTGQQGIAMMTMIIDGIHAISRMMGIASEKFMLPLRRPLAGMAQREQVMPSLHFLQKQDVGCHRGDGLLDPMNPRARTNGTDAFVNIPGSDSKFHAGRRCTVGLDVGLDVDLDIGCNVGLDVIGDGAEAQLCLGSCRMASALEGEKH